MPYDIPLFCPVYDVVTGDHRRQPVQDLAAEAPPGVEDGVVARAGEGVLTVRAQAIVDDAALRLGTCLYDCKSVCARKPVA